MNGMARHRLSPLATLVAAVWLGVPPPAAADCSKAAQLSGGARLVVGDHEGRIIEELGPPDRVVSTSAPDLSGVRERFVYYIPDDGRMETIWFELEDGRLRQVCEFKDRARHR